MLSCYRLIQTVLNMVSLTISTLLCCRDRSFVSSKECDEDNTLLSVALICVAVVSSSLAKDGRDVLALMLFIVAATLGIALKQGNNTIL